MTFEKLEATQRKRSGKGPARRLRERGLIPAVLYGQGIETMKLALEPRSFVKALSGPKRINTVLEVSIQGQEAPKTVMVKDHQYDPVSRKLLHVDLYAVQMDSKVKVDVPLEVEGRSQGEQAGGVLVKRFRTLPLECRPMDIPEKVVIDVTALQLNDVMTAKDVPLPENTALFLAEKTPVIAVIAKRAEEAEAAKEGEEKAAEAAAPEAAPGGADKEKSS